MAETCRDRFKDTYPSLDPVRLGKCPSWYGWLDDPEWCINGAYEDIQHRCAKCWDREIPEFNIKENEMTGTKETQCTNCIHREVCIHKMDFLEAQKAVDFLEYEHAKGGTVRLCDIPFIRPIELKCKHFYQATVVRG